MNSVIQNPAPLQTNYLPEKFVQRGEEKAALKTALSNLTDTGPRNLHLYGPRGQSKTHLTLSILEQLPDKVTTCYIPCTRYRTQYQILQQIYRKTSGEEIKDGLHTSTLQRKIEEKTRSIPTVIVLDEIDFTLLNDGNSLLYFLSRMEKPENTSIITVSSKHEQLPIEERTRSSLQKQKIRFPQYTGETIYKILLQRAQKSLHKQTLQRKALTYTASATTNTSLALTWLKTAAEQAQDTITEKLVQETRKQSQERYTENLLKPFTSHHQLTYQAIQELDQEQESDTVQSGGVYQRYQELCQTYNEESLSQRRVSDYLKHLELLDLINAEYHYGGNKGKTREIQLKFRS